MLARAKTETGDVSAADRVYDAAQSQAATLRPQADALIAEVMDQLRFSLRKQEASSQRRIMERYGAKFVPGAGEPANSGPPDSGAPTSTAGATSSATSPDASAATSTSTPTA